MSGYKMQRLIWRDQKSGIFLPPEQAALSFVTFCCSFLPFVTCCYFFLLFVENSTRKLSLLVTFHQNSTRKSDCTKIRDFLLFCILRCLSWLQCPLLLLLLFVAFIIICYFLLLFVIICCLSCHLRIGNIPMKPRKHTDIQKFSHFVQIQVNCALGNMDLLGGFLCKYSYYFRMKLAMANLEPIQMVNVLFWTLVKEKEYLVGFDVLIVWKLSWLIFSVARISRIMMSDRSKV